jgi:hypothetical protein
MEEQVVVTDPATFTQLMEEVVDQEVEEASLAAPGTGPIQQQVMVEQVQQIQ